MTDHCRSQGSIATISHATARTSGAALVALAIAAPPLTGCARNGDQPAAARGLEEVRYLALGDSFTAGTGNPPSAAFLSRLAALVHKKGAPSVLGLPSAPSSRAICLKR
jgi:hypothetical protein